MKEEIINQIQVQMLPYLNNEQLKALQSVLEHTFYGITITTETTPNNTNRNTVTAFIAAKRIEGCSEKTLAYYQNTIQAMISGIGKAAQQITTEDLRAYLTEYQNEHKISRVTIDNIRRILSSFFSWLEDEDYIVKSPVRRIHKVKTAKVIKETYTDEALELMRDNAPSLRDLAIIDLLASSGMRVGELVTLNRDDINFAERECVVFGKGDKERLVYFDARTKIHLQNYLGDRSDDNSALFVSLKFPHDRLQIGGVEAMLRELGRQLNLTKVHPHKFRRTLATSAIDKGILIVEKVEKGSAIEEAYKHSELTFEKAFDHYVVNGDRWNGLSCDEAVQKEKRALFEKTNVDKDTVEYSVLPKFTTPLGPQTKITLQAQKVKIFYFERGQSEALITCFREKISKNKSEFRNMPEDDPVFQKDDYTEIYVMDQTGVNKLRDVNGLKLDKYELSKYLGKYQRISGIVTDKKEHPFVKDIKKIFDDAALIENYTLWERIITILFMNHYYDELFDFIGMAKHAIDKTTSYDDNITKRFQVSLNKCLISCLARTFALYQADKKLHVDCSPLKEKSSEIRNIVDMALLLAKSYLKSRMFDKTLCAVWPELIFTLCKSNDVSFNLSSYTETLRFIGENASTEKGHAVSFDIGDFQYAYYPYLVTMAEISLANLMLRIATGTSLECANDVHKNEQIYVWVNYRHKELGDTSCEIRHIGNLRQHLFIKVGDEKFTSVNVAISSLKMSDDNFRLAHMKRPNRSYDRYQKIAFLVNTALKESANLLVMPEACTPLEWLPVLARTSSRNNMAIITGVEHIFSGTNVYNLTAVILPYTDRKTGAQGAHIFYHSKNHFAPGELQLIRGNLLQPFEGNGSSKNQSSYELYNWNDFLFSVYCCYELTSIADRSIFQSFADAIIAVEWNHDVNYYSNIIESLSRDVHCYCIQVNTSDYGDSRITQPTKTEKKDILRTKGGANAAVLVGKIEIAKLREFQAKTYELQKDDSTYKPTPPNFNSRIAYQKSTGQLSADTIKELFT